MKKIKKNFVQSVKEDQEIEVSYLETYFTSCISLLIAPCLYAIPMSKLGNKTTHVLMRRFPRAQWKERNKPRTEELTKFWDFFF